MSDHHDLLREMRAPTRELRRALPDVYAGFGQMHDAAFADGALSAKTKELVALSVAVVKGCEACIAYHARALAALGASDAEVAEAIGVTIVMDGGPAASGHGPAAFAAFREFAAAVPAVRTA
jgi:AhpD family alkylhydroperoxidase